MNHNSKDFFHGSVSDISVIPSGSFARDVYGHRFGSQLLVLNPIHLEALTNGNQLAAEILNGEFAIFLEADLSRRPRIFSPIPHSLFSFARGAMSPSPSIPQ